MKCPDCDSTIELKNFKKEGMWQNHWWCDSCEGVKDPCHLKNLTTEDVRSRLQKEADRMQDKLIRYMKYGVGNG